MAQPLAADKIRQLIEQKKRELQQRKQMVQTKPAAAPTSAAPAAASAPATAAPTQPAAPGAGGIDVNALQQRIRASLAKYKQQVPQAAQPAPPQYSQANKIEPKEARPVNLTLDAQGRVVDAAGNVIPLQRRTPEFRANVRKEKQDQLKGAEKMVQSESASLESNPYYDERIPIKPKERKRKALSFVEPGTYQDKADRIRVKQKLEKLQEDIASAAQKQGISSVTKLALITPTRDELKSTEVPDVEWWDALLLPSKTYANTASGSNDLNALVQHPVTLPPVGESHTQVTMPVMLTKKERKKLRTQRRKAEEQEKQERVRLGLEEAPAPKVKMSNMMRVLGTEATADPTQVEAMVRAQMQLRQLKHEEHNAAMKLTPEQRRVKKEKKLKDDEAKGLMACVYRIRDLRDEAKKYKVRMNAEQWGMTGIALMTSDINVVVVEGGPRAQRKYKALMLRRIKWGQEEDDSGDVEMQDVSEGAKLPNRCDLVWEGAIEKRAFRSFDMRLARSEAFAREMLEKKGVAHYWDLALSEAIVHDGEEES